MWTRQLKRDLPALLKYRAWGSGSNRRGEQTSGFLSVDSQVGWLRKDGWPRISPVELYIVDGDLLLG